MPTTDLAVTERGNKLVDHTEADVVLALRLLVLTGGSTRKTLDALADEGIVLTSDQLRYWRDVSFPTRYAEIRRELANDVGEQIAGRAMERALALQEAEDTYVAKAVEKVDDVSPDKLAASALALARAKSENVGTAQLLRNRPTEIVERRDTAELLELLAREGVLVTDPRHVTNKTEGVRLTPDLVEGKGKEKSPAADKGSEG